MSTPVATPPFNELQKRLFQLLSTELTGVGVYDNVPEDRSKPWATVGEVVSIPNYFHGGFGWDILATVHVWTKALGFKSANEIAQNIIGLLDHQRAALGMPSPWTVVSIRFERMDALRDPDPEIRHVPVQFRIVIHQEV